MTGDLDLVRRLVAADHGLAVVATTRADGSVHASVVNAGVLDDPLTGAAAVALVARGAARKVDLVRAPVGPRSRSAPAGSGSPSRVRSRSSGPTTSPPAYDIARLPQLLRDVFAAAGGTHDDWDEFDRVMAEEGRLAVLVEPARITSNG